MARETKIFLFFALVLIVAGWFFLGNDSEEQTLPQEEIEETEEVAVQTTKTYTSDTYAFTFQYPEEYSVLEYTPSRIAVGKSTTDGFASVADIALIQSDPAVESLQSYEEFVLDQARLTCAADGPNASISCIEIKDLMPYNGPAGSDAQTFSLVAEIRRLDTEVVEEEARGPYYTFNTSPNTLGLMSFLMLHNPVTIPMSEANHEVLEMIAETLVISERQYR